MPISVSGLETSHRAADALFRDSTLDGVMFRHSDKGRLLDTADARNAAGPLYSNPNASREQPHWRLDAK